MLSSVALHSRARSAKRRVRHGAVALAVSLSVCSMADASLEAGAPLGSAPVQGAASGRAGPAICLFMVGQLGTFVGGLGAP